MCIRDRPSAVASGGRIGVVSVRCRLARLHVAIAGATVGAIVGVTIAPTVAPTIASCKQRLRRPLVVVTQEVVKKQGAHMHVATTLRRRRTVRYAALMTTHLRPPPSRNASVLAHHPTASRLGVLGGRDTVGQRSWRGWSYGSVLGKTDIRMLSGLYRRISKFEKKSGFNITSFILQGSVSTLFR